MKKYIDTDVAYEVLTEYYHHKTEAQHKALREALDRVPAADVVEVVRCKDCKYREDEQPWMVYCQNAVGGWVSENWFCADGAKMDEVMEE